MQKCGVLIPLISRRSLNLQPSRNLFFRHARHPSLWNQSSLDFEDPFRTVERQFEQLRRELNSPWGLRGGLLPSVCNLTGSQVTPTTPMSMYEAELDGKYQMNVSMGAEIKPENIKVTLKDRLLTVEAKYDHTSEDGKLRVYQEFTQKFVLPKNVDPLQVKSKFTPEGVLQVEAPLPPPEPDAEKPTEIPIKIQAE